MCDGIEQSCDVLRAYSVNVVLKLTLRVFAQKQSCNVPAYSVIAVLI